MANKPPAHGSDVRCASESGPRAGVMNSISTASPSNATQVGKRAGSSISRSIFPAGVQPDHAGAFIASVPDAAIDIHS
jgi:hypothetical protein